ncbi:MAG: hypothetical protein Q4B26_02170 [Eubacteriales bacterium]|nr:hypothetical protein [Eubacteriales bacterium]
MRLKTSRVKTIYLFAKSTRKDAEGGVNVGFSVPGKEISAEYWPAAGRIQSEKYGERIKYIWNVRINDRYSIVQDGNNTSYRLSDGTELREGDAVGWDGESARYRIASIKPFRFIHMEVEEMVT